MPAPGLDAQAVTPAQLKRWKNSINVLDYLDFHAFSEEGLGESARKLRAGRGAPGWAIHVRQHCIVEGWNDNQEWVAEFAMRSQAAMAGIKILYPKQEDRVRVYRRLLLAFIDNGLAPLERDCPTLRLVRDLCREENAPRERWERLKESLKLSRKSSADFSYINFAHMCIGLVLKSQFHPFVETWWLKEGTDLGYFLSYQYMILSGKGRIDGQYHVLDTPGCRQAAHKPMADIFLAMLESECPRPDWLADLA